MGASSERTMIEAAGTFAERGMKKPYCLAVHPLFAEQSCEALQALAEGVASTDTITHSSNDVSFAELLAGADL